MRVHHLSCGTLCPIAAKTLLGGAERMICHCLLIETSEGLVLVDSGFGRDDVQGRRQHPAVFRGLLRPRLAFEETAHAQIDGLGLDPADVRHVVTTHLDLDHAGGLSDFPKAKVHVMEVEKRAALAPSLHDRLRYLQDQFRHTPDWQTYEAGGEPWFGFEAVRALVGLPPEILLIPLFGHSHGHAGVAVDTGAGWLLHAGDAYFHADEMLAPPRCPPGLSFFQGIVQADGPARHHNQARLRALNAEHSNEVHIFCAHDESELKRFA